MPDTMDAQFAEITGHAKANARLAQAAQLRARGNRRTRRRRGGAALLGTAAVAAAVGLGTTMNTAVTTPRATAPAKAVPAAASPAAYSTKLLSQVNLGHTVPTLANVKLTQAQIAGLEKLHVSVLELKTQNPSHPGTSEITWIGQHLTAAQITALQNLGLSAAQIKALEG
jgi:hypothetical protein